MIGHEFVKDHNLESPEVPVYSSTYGWSKDCISLKRGARDEWIQG